MEIDFSNPEVKALLDAEIAKQISGLTANKDEILKEKKAIQEKLEAEKKQWEGLDPAQVRVFMDRIKNDEETKLIAEGKVDEVISKRTEALKSDYQKKLDAAAQKEAQYAEQNQGLTSKITNLVIEGRLRQAAAEQGLMPTAIEDALLRARSVFSLSDDDQIVAKDQDGSVKLGKDGKSPLSPAEWLESMREKAPHWFPGSSGGGAGGGPGNRNAKGVTITRAEASNHQVYLAAKAQAAKAGVPLNIVN